MATGTTWGPTRTNSPPAPRVAETRSALLENFDEEVAAKLRVRRDQAQEALDNRRSLLWKLTQAELGERARFQAGEPRFELPAGQFRGHYHLLWAEAERTGTYFYREDHPLALALLDEARSRDLPPARLIIDSAGQRVAALERFRGAGGQLCLARLKVDSAQTEEFLLLAAQTGRGDWLDPDQCEKLLGLPARLEPPREGLTPANWQEALEPQVDQRLKQVETRNGAYFDEESGKLDAWAEDLKSSNERELKDIERELREAKAAKKAAATLQARLDGEKAVKALEARRNKMRRELYEQQDCIGKRRDDLIAEIEQQLRAHHSLESLFSVQWDLV